MYQPFPGAQILPVPDEIQALYDWAASQGIKWPKIVYPVLFPPGYIGSMATDTIEPGEAIVTAPHDSLITTRIAYQSGLNHVFESNNDFFGSFEDMNDDLVLASYLLSEKAKGPASPIAAFIGSQPKDPSNLQDWPREDLQELQDADLIHDTEKSWQMHREQWVEWKEIFSKHPDKIPEELLTLQEFTWAVRLIGTRSFGKFAPYTTFFPVGELLNHDNVQSYYIYLSQGEVADSTQRYGGVVDDEDQDARIIEVKLGNEVGHETLVALAFYLNQGFTDQLLDSLRKQAAKIDDEERKDLKKRRKYKPPGLDLTERSDKEMRIVSGATERYEKGAEVYMSYGRNSNRQLLSVYGFCLRINQFNFLEFKVEFKKLVENERLAWKKPIPDFGPNQCIKFKLKEKVICMNLIRTLRKLWWKKNLTIESFFKPKLMELELKILEKGLRLLLDFQNSYQTNLEEDLALLSGELPIRKYFAVLYRSQMKEILKNQITYFTILRGVCGSVFDGSSVAEAKEKIFEGLENGDKVRRALNDYLEEIQGN